jgi:NAD(P)-dependent dehydrogenase (short-subunit alcohol dehydrogenase family)
LINKFKPESERIDMTLQGKVALITGGTSGIGLAAAETLARANAHVVATGRSPAGLEQVRSLLGDRGEAIACDITEPAEIATMLDAVRLRHGQLDILVINAGISNAPAIADLTVETYAWLMDVNCRGVVFSFVHALPLLAEGASVIFIGSVAGLKGQPGDPLYAGSKGFIRAFARNAGTAPNLLARGIRVNTVSPGPTETPLTSQATASGEIRTYVERMIPMGRWGQAKEVANAILFLASDMSSFTTGAEITVDGGMAHG